MAGLKDSLPAPNMLVMATIAIVTGVVAHYIIPVFCKMCTRWWPKHNAEPVKWKRVGVLSALDIYPLKSGQALSLEEANCTELGLSTTDNLTNLRDRFFVVYNAKFLDICTARVKPKLVLISIIPQHDNKIMFKAPDMPELLVKIPDKLRSINNIKVCSLFTEKVETVDCGDEAATWFSQYLLGQEDGYRLGYHLVDAFQRRNVSKPPLSKEANYYKKFRTQDTVSDPYEHHLGQYRNITSMRGLELTHLQGVYSDLTSYMLMTESSMKDLNTKVPQHLQGTISSQYFRPNFMVQGSLLPYEEDTWEWIKIGDKAVFRSVKPCTRCILTTVNPAIGIMNPDKEPLKTLKSYRQVTNPEARKLESDSPVLGVYMGLEQAGKVRMGDPVYIEDQH